MLPSFVTIFVLYVLYVYFSYSTLYSAHDVYFWLYFTYSTLCSESTLRVQPEYSVLYSGHESTRHFQQSTWRILKYRVHDRVHNTVHTSHSAHTCTPSVGLPALLEFECG